MNYDPEPCGPEYGDADRHHRIETAAAVLAAQWAGDREQLHAALQVTRRDAQLLEDAGMLAAPESAA